jgi:predicted CoA-binding protein
VNPGRDTVDDDPAYPTLAEIPERPTIVNIVVPPQRTLRILEQAQELGLRNVWVQPGAENDEVLAYLERGQFSFLTNTCIMVRSRPHV